MRAAVLGELGAGVLEVRAGLEAVAPGPHEVKVRIMASGVCHSDWSAMRGDLWIPTPAVMGHEGAGVVESVGAEVENVQPGDHVVIAVSVPCGTCGNCTVRRSPHLCGELFFDVAGRPHFTAGEETFAAMGAIGTFAEMVTVRKESAIVIPDDVPFEIAALLGCGVTSGVGAVMNTVGVTAGSSVAVLGVGGVGMAALQGARLMGAETVVAVDPSPERRELALKFGATAACAPDELDSTVRKLTGDGFDYTFEAAGTAAAMRAAYDAARRGGTACVIGAGDKADTVCFTAAELYYNEKRFVASYHGSADFSSDVHRLLEFWRTGDLDLAAMITHRFDLRDVNEAFRLMRTGVGVRSVVTNS